MLLKPIEPLANKRRLKRCGLAMRATFENNEEIWREGNAGGLTGADLRLGDRFVEIEQHTRDAIPS